MCLVRGLVDNRSARDPNSRRVPSSRTPQSFRISPGDVGGRPRAESWADVKSAISDSSCGGNTARKYSSGVRLRQWPTETPPSTRTSPAGVLTDQVRLGTGPPVGWRTSWSLHSKPCTVTDGATRGASAALGVPGAGISTKEEVVPPGKEPGAADMAAVWPEGIACVPEVGESAGDNTSAPAGREPGASRPVVGLPVATASALGGNGMAAEGSASVGAGPGRQLSSPSLMK